MSRVLRINGDIDADSYGSFVEDLAELEEESKKPITIELCSGGGDTEAGLAFYGRIRSSPCNITVKVLGYAHSAAAIILMAGHKRVMDNDSWFMTHDETIEMDTLDPVVIASEKNHLEAMEQHWAAIFARHSNPTQAEWREMSRRTTYLNAQQCLELGIINEIARGPKLLHSQNETDVKAPLAFRKQ